MSDINYFVLTVADCEAGYRNTMVGHVKTLAQELLDGAGAVRVRVGVVATGDNPGAGLRVGPSFRTLLPHTGLRSGRGVARHRAVRERSG